MPLLVKSNIDRKNGEIRQACYKGTDHAIPEKCENAALFLLLRPWQTRTHCCGHIVAHDVSWAAQTGEHLLRTQTVSEQNQKHFLSPGHKICVRNKCCQRGQTEKHLCPQQCVLVCQVL